jgi:hypothetical protein
MENQWTVNSPIAIFNYNISLKKEVSSPSTLLKAAVRERLRPCLQ